MIAKYQTKTEVNKLVIQNNKHLVKIMNRIVGRIDMLERAIKDLQKAKCIICNKQLDSNNKSGYCNNCYIHSPQYILYQRNVQRELYTSPKNKERIKVYNKKNEVKIKKYQKKYQAENKEKMRELKNKWARKNRILINKRVKERKENGGGENSKLDK